MLFTSYLRIRHVTFCLIAFLNILSLELSAEDLLDREYTIGHGDVIDIQVWDNNDLNRTVEISQDGSFTFPLIGKVNAGGLSIYELENLITKRLADGYIIAPHVTVAVKEYQSQKVFIIGEVKYPGSYVLKRKTYILELISLAGGFTDKAERTIKIVRSRSSQQGKGSMSPSVSEENEVFMLTLDKYKYDNTHETFFVVNGDRIYVNAVPRFFVIGEVGKRGEFTWEKGITVRQAISLAGGPTQMAAQNRTRIIRVEDGKEEEYKVQMNDLVMPDDIIKVPGRYF